MDLPCAWVFSSSRRVAAGGRRDLGCNGRRLICVANLISVLPSLSHKYQSEVQCWTWWVCQVTQGLMVEPFAVPCFGRAWVCCWWGCACPVTWVKKRAAAVKVLLPFRTVKELSVWPGCHAVWLWARAGCLALDFGEPGPCMELPHDPSPITIASTELWLLELVCVGGKGCLALGTMARSPQHSELLAPKLWPCTPCSHSGDHLSCPLCLFPRLYLNPSLLSGLRGTLLSAGVWSRSSSPAQGLWLLNQAPVGPEDAQ